MRQRPTVGEMKSERRAGGGGGLARRTRPTVSEYERLERDFQARVRQEAAIVEIGRAIHATTDLPFVFRDVTTRVGRALGVDHVVLLEFRPDREHFLLRAATGWLEAFVDRATFPATPRSTAGYILRTDQVVLSNDLANDPRFSIPPAMAGAGCVSCVGVRIPGSPQGFGVLGAYSGDRQAFSQPDGYFLQAVAGILATALERNELLSGHKSTEAVARERQARVAAERAALERVAVLGQITDGVVVVDRAGGVIFVNEAARRILGRSGLGTPVDRYADVYNLRMATGAPYPPDAVPLARTVKYGETIVDAEVRIPQADGTEVIVEGSTTPVAAPDGTRLAAVWTFRDVTSQREVAVRQTQLIDAVSHELRTPLTVIKGQAQYLDAKLSQGRPVAADTVVPRLAKIEETATTLTTMVDHLINMSHGRLDQIGETAGCPLLSVSRKARELDAIGQVARALVHELTLEGVAGVIAEQGQRLFGAAAVGLWLADLERKELHLLAHRSDREFSPETLAELRVQSFADPSFSPQAARTGKPVEIRDVLATGLPLAFGRRSTVAEGLRSAFSQPLFAKGRLVGVITILYASPHAFLPQERELIKSLGDFWAVAIDNARLYRALQDANRRANESLALLDTLQEKAPIGFAFLDRNLRFVRINAAMAVLNGIPIEQTIGRRFADVLPNIAAKELPCARHVLDTGEAILSREVHGETPATRGQAHDWLANYYPVRLANGKLLGIGVVVVDVTESKRVERALRESQESLARAQRIAQLGSWERDITTGCLLWSDEVYRIFGVEPETFGGTFASFLARIHPEDRSRLEEAIQNTVGTGAPYSIDYRLVRPDGAVRFAHAEAMVTRDENGQPRRMGGTVQDVTALKQLEREREEWLSIIAHDLRQPVTVILGYTSLLAHKLGGRATPDERKSIDYILTSTQSLHKMIGDLLDVSRIETRRLKITCEAVALPSFLRGVVDRSSMNTEGHLVRIEIPGRLPTIEVDPSRIEQVVGNLLVNAAKYGDPKCDIVLRAVEHDREVEISVTNYGPGVAAEDLPKLFTRFYRSRDAQERREGGLGLGLYIAKGLVEAHHGRIWCESIPGKTTTFYFTLPLDGCTPGDVGPGAGPKSLTGEPR